MLLWDDFDRRAHRLGILDTKLVQGAAMCVALVIVKVIPEILTLSAWLFVALALVFAIKPVLTFFGPDRDDR